MFRSLSQRPLFRIGHGHLGIKKRTSILHRHYSKIDEFNKRKTTYNYGVDLSSTRHQDEEYATKYPDIEGVEKGTPEYKEKLFEMQIQNEENARKQNKKQEARERLKAVLYGVFLLGGIIATHQIVMNYEYLKNKLLHGWNYGTLDETKHQDLSDPSKNRNKISNLALKITEGLTEGVLNAIKPTSTPGLYIFGGDAKNKIPLRVPFFDDKVIKDVQLSEDLICVLTENNELYQLDVKGKKGKKILSTTPIKNATLPFKALNCQITNTFVYLLGTDGTIYYTPRIDSQDSNNALFKGFVYRNWLGLSRTNNSYGKVNVSEFNKGEKVQKFCTGENHILILTNKGRIFTAASSNGFNFGQFGIPKYSPFNLNNSEVQNASNAIPLNQAFSIVGLNNEVVRTSDGVSLKPRKFSHIAAGKYHNLVSDISGNVWTWGRNSYGECGTDVSYKTDIQSVPKIALTASDFYRATNHLFPTTKNAEDWSVDAVYAADESSYVKARFDQQDVLFTFGNGVKGQLANNQFLHVCSTPQAVKSLLNLSEFNEQQNKIVTIGIKDVTIGGVHGFVTLDANDVLAFGDNENGQLGNGKNARSAKPIQIPRLLEPEDAKASKIEIAKRFLDSNERLQMISTNKWEQKIVAGDSWSAIYYKCK